MALDAPAWQEISGGEGLSPVFGHPQFAMQALLARIGISRSEVTQLAEPAPRDAFVSEVLRPADSTEQWQAARTNVAPKADAAMRAVTVIEAANAEQEALAAAVVLRKTHEDGKTAALVTPDRQLAARVLAALGRWQVPVDDSGGDPLSDTPAGVFAHLAADVALGGLAPIPLLALLKHPLLRLGAL